MWVCSTKWKKFGTKNSLFYDELKCEWDMHSADDLVMCLGDFNVHVGRHIDGFDGVHERMNLIRVMSGNGIMCVKTWFNRREEKRKVIFRMGEN